MFVETEFPKENGVLFTVHSKKNPVQLEKLSTQHL